MKIGHRGIAMIQSYEKIRLRAYLPTPDDRLTIGWGHTGNDVESDTVWTRAQADEAFHKDIAWVEGCVNKCVTALVNQNEFDALCSLCFNIGCKAFTDSTLVKMLNQADFDGAAQQFKRWNKQAGKVLAGLTRRRAEEAQLFEENA